MRIIPGAFYEFHRERVISRPGAVLERQFGIEIGPWVPEARALELVRSGRDIYTPLKQDAKGLAEKADPSARPCLDPAHAPKDWQVRHGTNRPDVFFAHYHPGGKHGYDGVGHVYFGRRGDGFTPRTE